MNELFANAHALIIGVGADLPNTIDDAKGLDKILTDPARCAYPPDQVRLLTGQDASRQAILAGLDRLAQRADDESTVVVYFSGHGYLSQSPLGQIYFLIPHGYDVKQLYATTIRGDEFAAKLAAIPARKLLVLLDCCHAGAWRGGKVNQQGKYNIYMERASGMAIGDNAQVHIYGSKTDESH